MLASLHLARHQALPPAEGQKELQTALGLLNMLEEVAPDRVRHDVGSRLSAANTEPLDAERLNAEGARAYSDFQRTGRPDVLDAAITAFGKAATAAGPGHRDYAGYLSNITIALRARFDALKGSGRSGCDDRHYWTGHSRHPAWRSRPCKSRVNAK